MGILFFIVFGAIVGVLASWIMGSSTGLLMDIILGIVGSLVGGLIMNAFGQSGITGFNLYSILVGILGAIIIIWISRLFRRTAV